MFPLNAPRLRPSSCPSLTLCPSRSGRRVTLRPELLLVFALLFYKKAVAARSTPPSCSAIMSVRRSRSSKFLLTASRTMSPKGTGEKKQSCPTNLNLHLTFISLGHRATEEGGETLGQKVQMDEHEGGVWPPLLYSLAQPLCFTRLRQGGCVPVHRMRPGKGAELRCCSCCSTFPS